jgi:agmatine deiminase
MLTRRRFLRNTGLLAGSLAMGARVDAGDAGPGPDAWYMPDEGAPHERTWMAFGAGAAIWGRKLLPGVRRNLATLARTIVNYEPVSMLVRKREYDVAREMVGDDVELVTSALDDLWLRDTGPVFVITKRGKKAAVDFNFNGWGGRQRHRRDARVAALVAARAGVPVMGTPLVMEGGGLEVDGHGTAIITESCTLNANRNPKMSRAQFEDALMPLLGLEKIIWLPGIRGKDITDGHTDFYARFARPGVVLAGYEPDPGSFDHEVTKRHLDILGSAVDARGRKLEVVSIEGPGTVRKEYRTRDFAAGYLGFYVCNGAVIMQDFGDAEADRAALAAVQHAFPGRAVVQLNMDALAAGGGTIHCVTQQEPAA